MAHEDGKIISQTRCVTGCCCSLFAVVIMWFVQFRSLFLLEFLARGWFTQVIIERRNLIGGCDRDCVPLGSFELGLRIGGVL